MPTTVMDQARTTPQADLLSVIHDQSVTHILPCLGARSASKGE